MWLLVVLLLSVGGYPSSTSSTVSFLQADAAASILIDCGGPGGNLTTISGAGARLWIPDRYFSGGAPGVVAEPHAFPEPQQRTLRFFPPATSGNRNCYTLPIPAGVRRYHLRLFAAYDNYDSKLRQPSFDVSLAATLLLSYRPPWPPAAARYGAFSDFFAFAEDTSRRADVCFRSVDGDAPVVGSLELIPMDPRAYTATYAGAGVVLVNYGRLSCGGEEIFDPLADRYARVWQQDGPFLSTASSSIHTGRRILGSDLPPNHFPSRLYQSSTLSSSSFLVYSLPADSGLDYMLWFHFAEIDPAITAAGQRVFDVSINGRFAARIDVYAEVGGFAAFKWQHVARNVTGTRLEVKLVGVVGVPMLSGLESYAMVEVSEGTTGAQAEAMVALKGSLAVPERLGWNGDPCVPVSWGAWVGVTCRRVAGVGHVITHLDLSNQGLKGHISDKISLLSNLVSLNLSFNSLKGTLPRGINQASLLRLDLSGNKFSGSIPESFGSSNMQVVLLNDNKLEGRVPENLYSVGVHGGEIDLSGNRGLCGVPSLPSCPFFWQKNSLSTREKLVIGSVSAVLFCLIIMLSCILIKRRGRSGYNFAYSDELASVAAVKRPRYRRQKSLMQLEMESQHAKGFPSTLVPF